MKKLLCSVAILLAGSISILNAQDQAGEAEKEFTPSSKISTTVFANYHSTLIGDSITENAFEMARVYIGYKSDFEKHWSGEVKLDIGSQNESEYSNFLRYAFFKNAYLKYHTEKFSACFGLINLYQHKTQEKFWGYRYIYKSFQDKHKISNSADIGASFSYKPNKVFSVDFAITNGEGYKKIQSDKYFKEAVGITLNPVKQLTYRIYADYIYREEASVVSVSNFLGFKLDKFRVGGEHSIQFNNGGEDRDLWGISAYSTYELSEKLEIFGRFDMLRSTLIEDGVDENPWNIKKDGSAIIGGLQYKPAKKVKLSCNYQNWIYHANDIEDKQWLHINLEFKM